MKLYTSFTTPFGRKIMVQIAEAELEGRVSIEAVTGTPLQPGTMPVSLNPLGKIPALECDVGVLYDSRVISRYLDNWSGKGLYPAAPALWKVLTLEATADGILDAAVLMAYEVRLRPAEIQFADWLEAQWSKIARALDSLEENWIGHLSGPLDMGQIALACALAYLDFRHDARNWRANRPLLAAWYGEFAKRPSMQATQPPAA